MPVDPFHDIREFIGVLENSLIAPESVPRVLKKVLRPINHVPLLDVARYRAHVESHGLLSVALTQSYGFPTTMQRSENAFDFGLQWQGTMFQSRNMWFDHCTHVVR